MEKLIAEIKTPQTMSVETSVQNEIDRINFALLSGSISVLDSAKLMDVLVKTTLDSILDSFSLKIGIDKKTPIWTFSVWVTI